MGVVEEFYSIKSGDLKKLHDLSKDVFSKIGTEKSRQRLVYDLLNTLKTNDRERFLWLVLKNVNNVRSHTKKAREFTEFLSQLQFKYDTIENFNKIAYAIVMSIMSIESGGGELNE